MQSPQYKKKKPQELGLPTDSASLSTSLANARSMLLQQTEPELHNEISGSFLAFSGLLRNMFNKHQSTYSPSPKYTPKKRTFTPVRQQRTKSMKGKKQTFLVKQTPHMKVFEPVLKNRKPDVLNSGDTEQLKLLLEKTQRENLDMKKECAALEKKVKKLTEEKNERIRALKENCENLVEKGLKVLALCKESQEKQEFASLLATYTNIPPKTRFTPQLPSLAAFSTNFFEPALSQIDRELSLLTERLTKAESKLSELPSRVSSLLGAHYKGTILSSLSSLTLLQTELIDEQTNHERQQLQINLLKKYIRELEAKLKPYEDFIAPTHLRPIFTKVLQVTPELSFEAEEAIKVLGHMLQYSPLEFNELQQVRKGF